MVYVITGKSMMNKNDMIDIALGATVLVSFAIVIMTLVLVF